MKTSRSVLHPSPFGFRPSDFRLWTLDFRLPTAFGLLLAPLLPLAAFASSPDTLFQAGASAYRAADYTQAAEAFRQSVTLQPASGALQDLGNAEWQSHRTGEAILEIGRASCRERV